MRRTTCYPAPLAHDLPLHNTRGRILALIGAPFTQWLRRRETRQALSELSDRELLDIGIDRSDIPTLSERLAREPRRCNYRADWR